MTLLTETKKNEGFFRLHPVTQLPFRPCYQSSEHAFACLASELPSNNVLKHENLLEKSPVKL